MEAAAWAAAVPAVALFWWAVAFAGGAAARILRLRLAQPAIAHQVLGLSILYLGGYLLSVLGQLRPGPLILLVVAGGLAGAPAGVARLRHAAAGRGAAGWWLPGSMVAGVLVLLTLVPVFHYDLTANYLGVARQYLLQGHLWPLPHDAHSGASTFLHVLLAVLLALGEPLRTWGPPLAGGHVYSVFLLSVLVLTALRLVRLARLLTVEADDAAPVAALAFGLWITTPQTMLLYALKSTDIVTCWLVVTAATWTLEPSRRRADSGVLGLLLGLLLAAKLQLAPVAAVAAALAVIQRPAHAAALGAGLAATWLPGLLRALAAYGTPLYPFLHGDGASGSAAASLLAENAARPTWQPVVIARRLLAMLTRQPETGVTAALLAAALLARPRRWSAVLLVLLPALAIAAATDAVVNGLRWLQPLLPLALALAAAAMVRVRRRAAIWGGGAAVVLSLLLAIQLTGGMIGLTRHLRTTPAAYLASFDRALPLRSELARRPGRTLWLGFGESYYTDPRDLVPSVHDAAILRPLLRDDGAALASALRARGFARIVWHPRYDRQLRRGSGAWAWASTAQRSAVAALLGDPRNASRRGGMIVVELAPPTVPGSPPSPP